MYIHYVLYVVYPISDIIIRMLIMIEDNKKRRTTFVSYGYNYNILCINDDRIRK